MKTYADYDPFARLYDRHWAPGVCARLPILRELLLSHLEIGARVLDLCCGTGHLLPVLAAEGFRVTGLDGSSAMLAMARRKAPAATLIHADARSFTLDEKQDAVACLSDSLNHIMTLAELASAFRSVRSALRDGGSFLFDLNTEHKYATGWSGTMATVDEDLAGAFRFHANLELRRANFAATIFEAERDHSWRRTDFSLQQTWYARDEVHATLAKAGFAAVKIHEPTGPDKIYVTAA